METHPSPILLTVRLYKRYATWRFQTTGVSGGTIAADISGINTFMHHFHYGLNLHYGASAPLIRHYRGIDRIRKAYGIGRRSVFRRALTSPMLGFMLKHMDRRDPFMCIMRAAILYGQATGFRSHNFVYTKTGGNSLLDSVSFYPDIHNPTHMLVELPYGKTHQLNSVSKETRTVKCSCAQGLCAVHEVAALIKQRYLYSTRRTGPLFLLPDGSPVTYFHLKETLASLAELFDLDKRYYTPHCLRIGRATELHLLGWSLPRIMKFMGWTSRKSAMKYIRPNNPDFVMFGLE